jgi:uncharacterized Rossmann fold enzyme
MDWDEWKPIYNDIVSRLNIDSTQDRKATKLLNDLIKETNTTPLLARIETMIKGQDVIVFGSGPSLETHIEHVMHNPEFSNSVYIAADGATSALLELGARCDIIVTDLDGDMNVILKAMNRGSIGIVHAHGDNIPLVTEFVPRMNTLLGSTQVEPLSNVFLWGGFTDGDRACYMASHYSPKRIVLAGMDFGDVVGKWSKPDHADNFVASQRKRIKLDIAQMLLNRLWDTTGIPNLDLSLI